MADQDHKWDVFISYASEDRAELAGPLAERLASFGVKVWFDKFELRIGDSLRERIDEGLSQSRYGIVILSPAFFSKHYPVRELNGLSQLEINGEKVLLPIWKDVSDQEVRKFSPPLADRVALTFDRGIDVITSEIVQKVRPDILEDVKKRLAEHISLHKTKSGHEIIRAAAQANMVTHVNEDPNNAIEVKLIGEFLQGVEEIADVHDLMTVEQRVQLGVDMTQEIERLAENGWSVYMAPVPASIVLSGKKVKMKGLAVAVVRSDCESITHREDRFFIYRKPNN
ncbi:toll/interleukin-1 receptor domain-containing protein [Hymenobacter sp. ASUV-10]|uniref:Toll/interleukin-1 receptor domain-containing protein n=1 Tax=Hymenobacter aranciens TaxID=3063996 RepID=A0ABT9BL04_9BACT|nr:toll/interleukin-1 receptor domain-containing protein [Hymenobacter sp. ASUV-10]MDO7877677.1 toll/interleukin-1 receptor domain-containing protein [Hymenobacter sp. ASUV-10]